jgi:hypothetical protein
MSKNNTDTKTFLLGSYQTSGSAAPKNVQCLQMLESFFPANEAALARKNFPVFYPIFIMTG